MIITFFYLLVIADIGLNMLNMIRNKSRVTPSKQTKHLIENSNLLQNCEQIESLYRVTHTQTLQRQLLQTGRKCGIIYIYWNGYILTLKHVRISYWMKAAEKEKKS